MALVSLRQLLDHAAEKEVIRQVPVEAPSAAVPTKTEKECDAEVQELMIRAEKAEALRWQA